MISQKMTDAINDQIKAESESAYLYLAMSVYMEAKNFKGMACWLKKQCKEEAGHAQKFMEHLYERGARVVLEGLSKPAAEFGSPLDVFKAIAKHERYITGRINKMMDIAKEEKDYASQSMLNWFVDEQVEEEATADDVVAKLEFLGDSNASMYLLDKELGTRQ
jgi:ferritin